MLTLALGIGANTALFSVVNAVLLRPLPYRDPARIVQLWESNRASRTVLVSSLNFLDWRGQNRSFESMALYSGGPVTATGGDLPQRTSGTEVSRGFFDVFNVHPVLGRTFSAGDLQVSVSLPAVIGYGLWQRAFASDPTVIGKTVHISGIECHVLGSRSQASNSQTTPSSGSRSKPFRTTAARAPPITTLFWAAENRCSGGHRSG